MPNESLSGVAANESPPEKGDEDYSHGGIWSTLGSIGVVYGDIGTSPLYALRESLAHTRTGGGIVEQDVIGIVSLLLWALFLTVTLKYVLFLMRADNKGEGGTLALMALAQNAFPRAAGPVFVLGIIGA